MHVDLNFRGGPERGRNPGGDRFDSGLQLLHRASLKGSDRSLDEGPIRNHIERGPGLQRAQRDHCRNTGFNLAANQRLQGCDDLRGDDHGVDCVLWPRGVAASPSDRDSEAVRPRQQRAGSSDQRASWRVVADVQSEGGVDRRVFQQPALDHLHRAGAALLGRLEHELHGAAYVGSPVLKDARGSKQHRGVAIVAARVHHSRVL